MKFICDGQILNNTILDASKYNLMHQFFDPNNHIPMSFAFKMIDNENFKGFNSNDGLYNKTWDFFPFDEQANLILWQPELLFMNSWSSSISGPPVKFTCSKNGMVAGVALLMFVNQFVGYNALFSVAPFPTPRKVAAGDIITLTYVLDW